MKGNNKVGLAARIMCCILAALMIAGSVYLTIQLLL